MSVAFGFYIIQANRREPDIFKMGSDLPIGVTELKESIIYQKLSNVILVAVKQ